MKTICPESVDMWTAEKTITMKSASEINGLKFEINFLQATQESFWFHQFNN